MNVAAKLTAFAAATTAVFGLAFGVGSLLDPIAPEDEVGLTVADGHGQTVDSSSGDGRPAAAPSAAELPGLAVSARGYTLQMLDVIPEQGDAVEIGFTVTSPDGGSVLNFDTVHEKEMHLIVVRRDLSGFQHLHPEMDEDGTWRTSVDLGAAGVYRFFADFTPSASGEPVTLGTDVFVPGEYQPTELPEPETRWASDGYEVTLSGAPAAGAEGELSFTVTRDGAQLSDLEPYLGAFGHLVSLRSGDLAYLHTHPADEARAGQRGGPEVRFATTFPTAGRYRLYLNFAHGGEVRTAEFTVEVPEGTAHPAAAPSQPAADTHSGH